MAISRSKGRFPLVSFAYSDPVVGVPQIDLREKSGAVKAVEKVVNERQRVSILDGYSVETSVVNAETKLSRLPRSEKNGSSSRALRLSNPSFIQSFLEVFRHQFDGVVDFWAMRRRFGGFD